MQCPKCSAAMEKVVHEGVEIGEVVGIVGIAHDDEAPARCSDAASECGTVAFLGHRHYPRTKSGGSFLGAVGAAVIGDQHLAGNAGPMQIVLSLADAGRDRLRLVEAGHQDGQFQVLHARPRRCSGAHDCLTGGT